MVFVSLQGWTAAKLYLSTPSALFMAAASPLVLVQEKGGSSAQGSLHEPSSES